MLTIFVFERFDAKAQPRGHRHLKAQPLGIFCCAKAPGLGTHFSAKAPGCPGGGVVTGQIDTCINEDPRRFLPTAVHTFAEYKAEKRFNDFSRSILLSIKW